jgi:Ca-activated chloride channel family protein
MTAIRGYVDGLVAGGDTAIYSALDTAYAGVAEQVAIDPDKLYSVVLMSDGENNSGLSFDEFRSRLQDLAEGARSVRTYPILFGEASEDSLQQVADETGGRLFDATKTALNAIFKQIRGYQ